MELNIREHVTKSLARYTLSDQMCLDSHAVENMDSTRNNAWADNLTHLQMQCKKDSTKVNQHNCSLIWCFSIFNHIILIMQISRQLFL